MDPHANLTEQRELAQLILARPNTIKAYSDDPAERYDVLNAATRLAELVVALDEWRAAGGFDPYAPASPLPEPPEHLRDAWDRYQSGGGGGVTAAELRELDEWRADCAEDAGF